MPALATVAILCAGMLGLAIGLLAVPIGVTFRFERIDAFIGQIAIRWMFGLVRVRIRIPRVDKPAPKPAATARKKPATQRAGRNILAVLGQTAFRRRVYRLLMDLFGAVHLHRLRLRMRLGLGDPADTGCLWAIIGPLHAVAQNLRELDIRIEPEFMDPVCEFQADGRLRLTPLRILMLAVGFALSPTSIRAWRALKSRHG